MEKMDENRCVVKFSVNRCVMLHLAWACGDRILNINI